MSAVVNYLVFMTFYPACLALVLEVINQYLLLCNFSLFDLTIRYYLSWQLSNKAESNDGVDGFIEPATHSDNGQNKWQHQVKLLKQMMAMEQPNPVVQRVKLIMAAGLMVVHAHR